MTAAGDCKKKGDMGTWLYAIVTCMLNVQKSKTSSFCVCDLIVSIRIVTKIIGCVVVYDWSFSLEYQTAISRNLTHENVKVLANIYFCIRR